MKQLPDLEKELNNLVQEVSNIEADDKETETDNLLKFKEIRDTSKRMMEESKDSIMYYFYFYEASRRFDKKHDDILNKTIELQPKNIVEFFQKFVCFINLERFDDAIHFFTDEIENGNLFRGPEFKYYCIDGTRSSDQPMLDKENKKPTLNKDSILSFIHSGMREYSNRNYYESIKRFEDVLHLDSTNILSYLYLARIYLKLNKFGRCLEYYERCTRLKSINSLTYVFLAFCFELIDKTNQNLSTFFDIPVREISIAAFTFCSFSRLFLRRDDYASAITCAKNAILFEPDLPYGYIHLGFVLSKMGRFSEAAEAFIRATKTSKGKEDGSIYYNIGSIYFLGLNDYDKAYKYFLTAKKIFVANENLRTAKYFDGILHLLFAFKNWSEGDFEKLEIELKQSRDIFSELGFVYEEEYTGNLLDYFDLDKSIILASTISNKNEKIRTYENIMFKLDGLKFGLGNRILNIDSLIEIKKSILFSAIEYEETGRQDYSWLEKSERIAYGYRIWSVYKHLSQIRSKLAETIHTVLDYRNTQSIDHDISKIVLLEKIREDIFDRSDFSRDQILEKAVGPLVKTDKSSKAQKEFIELEERKLNVSPTTSASIFLIMSNDCKIIYQDKEIYIKNTIGARYIAYLLGHPNKIVRSTDLYYLVAGYRLRGNESDYVNAFKEGIEDEEMEITYTESYDESADDITKYRVIRRIDDLKLELCEAKSNNDMSKIAKLNEEIDFITQYLIDEYGKEKKFDRKIDSNIEKSRKSISNAISRTLKEIKAKNEDLWASLSPYIRMGSSFSYTPPNKTRWEVK